MSWIFQPVLMWRLRRSAGNNGIADFRLPISDWLLKWSLGFLRNVVRLKILKIGNRNWQSEID